MPLTSHLFGGRQRMRKLLAPKFLFLFFWLIVVLASLTILPNVQTVLTDRSTPSRDAQTLVKTQAQWGHGLARTQPLTLVFTNPAGKLTAHQKQQIHATLNTINLSADTYGIKQLRTSQTMTNDQRLLTSTDGSTLLAIATVDTAHHDLVQTARALNRALPIAGLTTAVTSPDLLQRQHADFQRNEILSGLIIGSLVLLLVLGLLFRSILVPLINLLTQTIVLITSTSLITNALKTWRLPFASSSLLLIGLIGLLVSTLLTWSFMRDYWTINVDTTTPEAGARQALSRQFKRWLIVLVPVIVVTFSLSGTQLISLASAWAISLTVLMATLAAPTLAYALTSLLGPSLYWPGTATWHSRAKNLWGQLARFSHWQPWLAFIVALLLVMPGWLNVTTSFDDANLRPIKPTKLTAAEHGQQLVTAHFGSGASTPITLMVHADGPLTRQATLQTLDQLTTKLQAISHVAQVTSVTQPISQKISSFYVANQVPALTTDLAASAETVTTLQKQLTTQQQNLQAAKTADQPKALIALTRQLDQVITTNDDLIHVLTVLNQALTTPSATSTRRVTSKPVSADFKTLDRLTAQLTTQLASLDLAQLATTKQAQIVDHQVQHVTENLHQATTTLKPVLTTIKSTSHYLNGLADSQIGQQFYAPKDALTNSRYQNSLFTNLSSDKHTAQFVITLDTPPTSPISRATLRQIQRVADFSLSATPLKKATITSTGIINQQANRHQLIRQHGRQWALITAGILGLCLWFALKSLTLSMTVTAGLALTLVSSWGWTQLLVSDWFKQGPLSSQVFLWSGALIGLHWLITTTIALNHRQWLQRFNAVELLRHFYRGGQLIWPVTLFELCYLGALLLSTDPTLRAFCLMSLFGILLSNLLIPLVLPGLITWTVHPPKWTIKRRSAKSDDNS